MKFNRSRGALRCLLLITIVLGTLGASGVPGARADEVAPYRNPTYLSAFQELLTAKWPNQFSTAERALVNSGVDLSIRSGLFRARGAARTYPKLGVTDVLNYGRDRAWRVYVNSTVKYTFGVITGDWGFGHPTIDSTLQGLRWAASCRGPVACPDSGSSFPSPTLPKSPDANGVDLGWWVLNWRYQSPGWSSRLFKCPAVGWTPANHWCSQAQVDGWKWFGEPNDVGVGGQLEVGRNDDGSVADCDGTSAVEPCYYRVQSIRQMNDRIDFDRFDNWTTQTYEADTDFRPYSQTFNADAARDELDRPVNQSARAWINHQLDPAYPDPRAPALVAAPEITGLANNGEVLAASTGTWSNGVSSPYTYQWLRCDATGGNCLAIFGATGASYGVTTADMGSRLRARVTAGNSYGGTAADSAATPLVLEQVAVLANDFRPALRFDRDEGWRPLNVHSFFTDEYSLSAAHLLCTRPGSDPIPDPCGPEIDSEDDLASPWSGSGTHYIQIHGSADNGADYVTPRVDPTCHADNGFGTTLRDCNSGSATAIYYFAGQSASGYRYLDYWILYRYNDLDAAANSIDDHEGDWEGVTVVLDARTTTSPSVAGVIFAQHEKLTWVLPDALQREVSGELLPFGNAPGPQHAASFVAKGSHASYPDVCTYGCPNPSQWPFAEGHHGGEVPWGENAACGECVLELPRDPHAWTFYPGHWGSSIENAAVAGNSPFSPGIQDRYLCTKVGWQCGSRPDGLQLFSRTGSHRTGVVNPRYCASWAGGGIAVIACDEARLRASVRDHELRTDGRYSISVVGRQGGSAPGIAQVVGAPLTVGQILRFKGTPTSETNVAVRVKYGRKVHVIQMRPPNYANAIALVRAVHGKPALSWRKSR